MRAFLVSVALLAAALSVGPAQAAPDLAYGAYQRGHYNEAFREATLRLEKDKTDSAAMTLLGELYNQGLGVAVSPGKAADAERALGIALLAQLLQVELAARHMDAVGACASGDDGEVRRAVRRDDESRSVFLNGSGQNLDVVHEGPLVGLRQPQQQGRHMAGRAGLRETRRESGRVFDDGGDEIKAGCRFGHIPRIARGKEIG
jgi:hypothetical protein